MEWCPAGWSVSASVNLPLHHKVQTFSSGTGSPGWSRKEGRKTVVVWWWYVCIFSGLHFDYSLLMHPMQSLQDYCNSLCAHSSVSTRQRLQRVQNCAARLVADAPHRASSRPLLHQLHWLPVKARITYKLCAVMYHIFNGTVPQYLAELCQLCSDDRLRSSSHQDYAVPRTYKRLADGSFSVAGPTAWNSLPVEFRHTSIYSSFRSHLKAFSFSKFYSQ